MNYFLGFKGLILAAFFCGISAVDNKTAYIVGAFVNKPGNAYLENEAPKPNDLVLVYKGKDSFQVGKVDEIFHDFWYKIITCIDKENKSCGGSVVLKKNLYKLPTE